MPYLDDSGRIVADSTLIRWHLEKTYHIDFDEGLSAAERGIAWAVEKLLEDNLYWAIARMRWLEGDNFAKGPAQFFRAVPAPLRGLVEALVRRKVRQALWAGAGPACAGGCWRWPPGHGLRGRYPGRQALPDG